MLTMRSFVEWCRWVVTLPSRLQLSTGATNYLAYVAEVGRQQTRRAMEAEMRNNLSGCGMSINVAARQSTSG